MKPKIKGNKPKPSAGDHSLVKERHKPKRHAKGSKKAVIHIDREEVVDVDRGGLPEDAEFKDCEDVVVQDLFGPHTQEGVQVWDTFKTLAVTARKLEVSFYTYLHDRISGTNQIPPLASLVKQHARELNPGWSWSTARSCPYLLRRHKGWFYNEKSTAFLSKSF